MENPDKYVFQLKVNSVYFFKISLDKTDTSSDKEASVYFRKYTVINSEKQLVSQESLHLPMNGKHKFEQTIFMVTDVLPCEVEFLLSENQPCVMQVTHSAFYLDAQCIDTILSQLPKLQDKSVIINSKLYYPFIGVQEVIDYAKNYMNSFRKTKLPILKGKLKLYNKPEKKRGLIGLIGNESFAGLLNTYYDCIVINKHNVGLIEANQFDVIIFQKRSRELIEDSASRAAEQEYLSKLCSSLQNTAIPVLELESLHEEEEYNSVLSPRLNCTLTESVKVNEYEVCSFTPIQNEDQAAASSTPSILIPVVDDMTRFGEFKEVILQLSQLYVNLVFSETSYVKLPSNYLDFFINSKAKIKGYDHLTANQFSEICRSCRFVLLSSLSIRHKEELSNLSAIAIMSGSIPIIFGETPKTKLGKLIKSVLSYTELYDYIQQNSQPHLAERTWVTLFRKFCKIRKEGLFQNYIDAIIKKSTTVTHANSYPWAEFIAVTMRPNNFSNILHNFQNQSYPYLKLHVIFNISDTQIAEYQKIVESYANIPGLRISIMKQNYNLGACLNYGIRSSSASYWFKMDDDDHYGKYYIEDSLNWYDIVNVDAMGKPVSIVNLEKEQDALLLRRGLSLGRMSPKMLHEQRHFHIGGHTLSGSSKDYMPYFSCRYRRSTDSQWQTLIKNNGLHILSTDFYNTILHRNEPKQHTYQVKSQFWYGFPHISYKNQNFKEWTNAE